jgi:hypothetical protein
MSQDMIFQRAEKMEAELIVEYRMNFEERLIKIYCDMRRLYGAGSHALDVKFGSSDYINGGYLTGLLNAAGFFLYPHPANEMIRRAQGCN